MKTRFIMAFEAIAQACYNAAGTLLIVGGACSVVVSDHP